MRSCNESSKARKARLGVERFQRAREDEFLAPEQPSQRLDEFAAEGLAEPFVGNRLANWLANQVGYNLPAMPARDILRSVDVLAAREDVDPTTIRAIARGTKGIWQGVVGSNAE